jgi:hypothetical protein
MNANTQSTQSTANSTGLEAIELAGIAHYGLSEANLGSRAPLPAGSGTIPVSVPVVNGSGSLTTPSQTTFWVTIKGTLQLTAPSGGTWNVSVIDIANGNAQVYKGTGLVVGTAYPFGPYKTAFKAQLQVNVQWSESGNTTLKGVVNYSY